MVKADVANCYGSIYTHSIPWALHTKQVAKSKRTDLKLSGNLIDKYLRSGQDGQTIGIPVGTDASFVVAELILSSVDNELQSRHSGLKGFRFYDDYEIVCSDESEAKRVLSTLEGCLAEYELSLNRRKTAIIRLPDELDYGWLTELRKFKFSENIKQNEAKKQTSELIDFANIIFQLSNKYPNDPILRYALVMLIKVDIVSNEVWKNAYQNLLIQIYRSEPQLSHLVAHQLLHYATEKSYTLDEKLLKNALSDQIVKYAPTRATNEVAWALWMAILFEIKFNQIVGNSIVNLSDNIVAILAFHADKKGLFESVLNTTQWENKLIEGNIYSEDWLLTYEIPAQGWGTVKDGSDYINKQACFGALNARGVLFYDETSYKTDIKTILNRLHINSDFYAA